MSEIQASAGSVVWKYPLRPRLTFAAGSILHIGVDPQGVVCAWVLVHDQSKTTTRDTQVVATGQPLPAGEWVYLNTFTEGAFVWHAFTGWADR